MQPAEMQTPPHPGFSDGHGPRPEEELLDRREQPDGSAAPDVVVAPESPNAWAAQVAAEGPESTSGHVVDRLATLERRVGELVQLQKHDTDIIDGLHAENQRLRAGEVRAAILPLLRDLIRLRDDLVQIIAQAEAEGSSSKDLAFVLNVVDETLDRNGLVRFVPEIGAPFDTTLHAAVGVVSTDDASSNRLVAGVHRCGFKGDDGSVTRPAQVLVHRFEPSSS